MSTSPSDQMFERMDQSQFAVVPRDLVETFIAARESGDWSEQQAAALEIAQAAADDIT